MRRMTFEPEIFNFKLYWRPIPDEFGPPDGCPGDLRLEPIPCEFNSVVHSLSFQTSVEAEQKAFLIVAKRSWVRENR